MAEVEVEIHTYNRADAYELLQSIHGKMSHTRTTNCPHALAAAVRRDVI